MPRDSVPLQLGVGPKGMSKSCLLPHPHVRGSRKFIAPHLYTPYGVADGYLMPLHRSIVLKHHRTNALSWCLSSSQSCSVGLSTQDEAMDVVRSTPQEAHYNADVIHLNQWACGTLSKAYANSVPNQHSLYLLGRLGPRSPSLSLLNAQRQKKKVCGDRKHT